MENFKAKKMANRNRQHCVEILLYDTVTKDIQSMLRPLNIIQHVIFCPKYSIKDNFITPNNCQSTIVSICAAFLFAVTFVIRNYLVYFDKNTINYSGYYREILYVFDSVFYSLGFLMNAIVAASQQKSNIDFVLTIQEVHNKLNVADDFKKFVYGNWICIIILFADYFVTFFSGFILFSCPMIANFVLIFLIGFDINIIYDIRLIKLMKDKLVLWNKECLNAERTNVKLFQSYAQILKCFKILQNTLSVLILYHLIETSVHFILYLKTLLDIQKHENYTTTIAKTVFMCFWLFKNLVLQISLSAQCQSLYDTVENAQDTCRFVMNSNCSAEERRQYKNVQRLHKATFSKMSACGLFYVDATLPLRLVGLLTLYTIVMLQFAFL